jgi:hypothetical protein
MEVTVTDTAEKVRENRLRAAAQRQGYELRKSRRRDERAASYGGWMIVDPRSNSIEAGGMGDGFQMTIDDIERWLTSDDADVLTAWALTEAEAQDLGGGSTVAISREGMRNPEPSIDNFDGYVGKDVYSFDADAADQLLAANGYQRTSPWLRGRGEGHECKVAAVTGQ